MKLKPRLAAFLISTIALASTSVFQAPAIYAKKAAATQESSSKIETKEVKAALLDINSASKEELQTISGIGTTYSEAIIKGRPYKNKRQLLTKKILPENVYAKVSDKIIAKQK